MEESCAGQSVRRLIRWFTPADRERAPSRRMSRHRPPVDDQLRSDEDRGGASTRAEPPTTLPRAPKGRPPESPKRAQARRCCGQTQRRCAREAGRSEREPVVMAVRVAPTDAWHALARERARGAVPEGRRCPPCREGGRRAARRLPPLRSPNREYTVGRDFSQAEDSGTERPEQGPTGLREEHSHRAISDLRQPSRRSAA